MATVRVQVAGGATQMKTANTVGELAKLVGADGYTATVDGEPAEYSDSLSGDSGDTFVSFAKPTKAG